MGVPIGITLDNPKFPLFYETAAEIDELKPRGMFGVNDTSGVRPPLQGSARERPCGRALARRADAISAAHRRS